MGVRQMELVNKFDNALSGVTGDSGEVGVAVNNAQFAETNSYWDMRHCEPAQPGKHDKNQYAVPDDLRRPAGRSLRCDRSGSTAGWGRPAALPAAGPLQRARSDQPRRAPRPAARPIAACWSTPTT